jgi:hypothetical protein
MLTTQEQTQAIRHHFAGDNDYVLDKPEIPEVKRKKGGWVAVKEANHPEYIFIARALPDNTIENRAFTVWRKMLTFVGGLHESVAEEAGKLRQELAGGSKVIRSSWIEPA